jgi:hypothetical protein
MRQQSVIDLNLIFWFRSKKTDGIKSTITILRFTRSEAERGAGTILSVVLVPRRKQTFNSL